MRSIWIFGDYRGLFHVKASWASMQLRRSEGYLGMQWGEGGRGNCWKREGPLKPPGSPSYRATHIWGALFAEAHGAIIIHTVGGNSPPELMGDHAWTESSREAEMSYWLSWPPRMWREWRKRLCKSAVHRSLGILERTYCLVLIVSLRFLIELIILVLPVLLINLLLN